MNKIELVNVVAEKAGLTKVDAKKAVDAVVKATVEAINNGERVSLVGFGTFMTVSRKARKGRNPQTGAKIMIPEKKLVKFRAGSGFAK
ncbi:MAG: HU family DNA-binding protein [Bacteroidales bacterium]|nr:HU family DNA-binding protein [Bacteroidales bacterium]